MDNGTMVEMFKSLNYYQLAKSSLVSKRFRDLIRNSRQRLALLYVDEINMKMSDSLLLFTDIFDKTLSPEKYDEWVVCNQYSKQIPLENQMAVMQSTQHERSIYQLYAFADPDVSDLFVRVELNNENWPLFQHFIRLLTDPFIYLHELLIDWTAQKYGFNLLTGIINLDKNRLQCHKMKLYAKDTVLNVLNLTNWAKYHLLCDELEIQIYRNPIFDAYKALNHDEALLDFF